MFKRVVAIGVLVSFTTGCATRRTVLITTEPENAQVRIDGELLSSSPPTFVDEFGSIANARTYRLEASAPGYKKLTKFLTQAPNINCVTYSVIGGLLLVVPWIGLAWCSQLPEAGYSIALEPDASARRAEVARP